MTNVPTDTELETELQDLYIQVTHWLQDISFLQTETLFFSNVLNRYQANETDPLQKVKFSLMIKIQENRLSALKTKIPVFLDFLEPYIADAKKQMHLSFLERYNILQTELQQLFNAVRTTKKELFDYAESIMPAVKIA